MMDYLKGRITKLLVEFFDEDVRRIHHALEVLGEVERLLPEHPEADEEIVIAAALLHDVGIKPSEQELGYNDGKTQEEYGPPIAEALLGDIAFPEGKLRVVSEIIGNHHSPSRYDYVELALLKKADRIVNRREGG